MPIYYSAGMEHLMAGASGNASYTIILTENNTHSTTNANILFCRNGTPLWRAHQVTHHTQLF